VHREPQRVEKEESPTSQETLTEKQKELVAVGASIAAGCRPCTTHHVAAARAAGAGDVEIRAAVQTALAVRDSDALSIARMVRRVATEKIELALKDSPDDGSGAGVCSGQGSPGDASASCG
jgi:AhpD family alkylhydroperoxidase